MSDKKDEEMTSEGMTLEEAEELVNTRKERQAEFDAALAEAGKVISAANPAKPRPTLAECVNGLHKVMKKEAGVGKQVKVGKGKKEKAAA